jgi:murein DD-endopeptidase MepM/ murein hydrolase activator NlpD
MRVAFWSEYGRGACGVIAGLSFALAAAGCSSGVSRFDFPSFSLADNESGEADMTTTSSLPVPSESVYSPGRYNYYGDRSAKPVPQSTAAYSANYPTRQPRYYGSQQTAKAPAPPPVSQASGPRIKVQSGDTLSSLSQRYGVSIDSIQTANNLPDARLREGQTLIMPGAKVAAAPQSTAPATAPEPRVAAVTPAPRAGETTYTVQAGDTPRSIAQKLGANEKSIMVRNDVRADSLQVGQTLIIPAGGAATAASQMPVPNASSGVRTVKTTTIPAPGSGDTTQSTAKTAPAPAATQQKVASTAQLPNPDPMSGASFRWPVKGRVISGFGTKPDGGHNDGINISVPQGTPVKAAENGVVAYAGNELKGYGNLVLVRHANNWVSAYANNDELLVKRGDKVARGQVIGKAGTTGSVSQPQVHFELRKGSRPVDPTKYMTSMSAQAD